MKKHATDSQALFKRSCLSSDLNLSIQ